MHKFGSLIRSKREESGMLLRHLAAKLDIDTAMLSKIERGERTAKRDHVDGLIDILSLDKDDTMSLWLADQLYEIIEDQDVALRALKVAEEEVKYKIRESE